MGYQNQKPFVGIVGYLGVIFNGGEDILWFTLGSQKPMIRKIIMFNPNKIQFPVHTLFLFDEVEKLDRFLHSSIL